MMKNSELNRIPSIELQLLKWLSLVDSNLIPGCVELVRGGSRVYIKRARQNLAGFDDDVKVLTLSNVQVNQRLKGKGWFTGFLDLCDELNPWSATYVESVENTRLPPFLRRQGFIELQYQNFYRPSKSWRSRHSWTTQIAADAQACADRSHVRSLLDDPVAVAGLALELARGVFRPTTVR